MKFDPIRLLEKELKLPMKKIDAVVQLFEEGNTVPFIARYRKEVTGELDEVQIRKIQDRHAYLLELEERRQTILTTIEEQGKLTNELRAEISTAATKSLLEDLYLPYRRKRRTRATKARERGFEPLALQILAQPVEGVPSTEVAKFINPEKGVPDLAAVWSGARDIVAEVVSERAEVRALVRDRFFKEGQLEVKANPKLKLEPTKFEQYYDYQEAVGSIPSHRFLAIRRGEREKVLKAQIVVDTDKLIANILSKFENHSRSPLARELFSAVEDGYFRLLAPSVENDVRAKLKERSDRTAVEVFANNLKNLILAAPLGQQPVVGIDPGLRTGCKCVAVSETGKFLENQTIYLSRSEAERNKSKEAFIALLDKHKPQAVAVGNGTGGRETESFVGKILDEKGDDGIFLVQVSEAGASVYSASDLARQEFPDLDLTVRGAISIARRLQDPLAELVKIEPKSIGVGQYQHDVHQPLLTQVLDQVVESSVNQVGVELNTASVSLLSRVAGVSSALAKKIINHRETYGPFRSRKQLLKVSGLGKRSFEQAAGFIRIQGGEHPLDASAVHPERYALVESIAKDLKVSLADLVGDSGLAKTIEIDRYVSEQIGAPTLRDIVVELKKPGRDPRQSFKPPAFLKDVTSIEDLKKGMEMEGVVTNVTNFGAFVDIGVHRDGLVHISQLADRFVKDPNQVVKVGDHIRVRVLELDLTRKRISLTARALDVS